MENVELHQSLFQLAKIRKFIQRTVRTLNHTNHNFWVRSSNRENDPEAATTSASSHSVSNSAFEKKMNEQMSKGEILSSDVPLTKSSSETKNGTENSLVPLATKVNDA